MPSPTSSTWPISTAWSLLRYWSISFVRTEAISSALNLMTTSLDDLVPEVHQLGAHRAVELPIVDAHHQAAQQFGIDLEVHDRFEFQRLAHGMFQALAVVVGQRHRAAH